MNGMVTISALISNTQSVLAVSNAGWQSSLSLSKFGSLCEAHSKISSSLVSVLNKLMAVRISRSD